MILLALLPEVVGSPFLTSGVGEEGGGVYLTPVYTGSVLREVSEAKTGACT